MAERLLQDALEKKERLCIKVSSAGAMAADGLSPAANTIEAMKKIGLDVSGYKTKALTDEMIKQSDVILVMERLHRDEVLRRVPAAADKTFLLKRFKRQGQDFPASDSEILDPIGLSIDEYENCVSAIKKEIERIIEFL